MGRKANADNCPHPATRLSTPSFGRTKCDRCDADITAGNRSFEWRHSPRVTLSQGDRIHVKAGPHGAAFKGTFQWAETGDKVPVAYCVVEKQKYQDPKDKRWYEGSAAVRFIRPEYVRRDDGVRVRNAREQAENDDG